MKRFAIFYFFVFICLHAWPQDVEKAFEYYNTGRYLEAATEFEAALPLIRSEYGEYDTAYYVNFLFFTALSHDNAKQFNQAEIFYLKAKQIYEAMKSFNNPTYINILNYLAGLYISKGQFENAIKLFPEISNGSEYLISQLINKADEYLGYEKFNEAAEAYDLSLPYFRIKYGEYDTAYYAYYLTLTAVALKKALNFIPAEEKFLHAKQIYESINGYNDPFYSVILNNLAELYEEGAQYDKAIPLYIKALENTAKMRGKKHLSYLIRLDKLADLYWQLGYYDKALPLFLESLEIKGKSLGQEHPSYCTHLNKLAMLYRAMGQFDKALPFYIEALGNIEKSLGKEHPSYATPLSNLAELYRAMGHYEKSIPLFLKSLEITEKSLGKEHSEYGITLNNLAELYKELGHYEKAKTLYTEALNKFENKLGRENNNYGICLNNLAGLYREMGQYEKALPLYLEAIEIFEKALGNEHPEYGTILSNIAGFYKEMGQYEKALPLFLEALEIKENSFGREHSSYGISVGNLAQLYQAMGQNDKALAMYIEAFEITKKALGNKHAYYGISLSNLAQFYESIGQYDKAMPLYLEAFENTENSLGKEHLSIGIILNNIAVLYYQMNQYDAALLLFLEALEVTEKSLGRENIFYGIRSNSIALSYWAIDQYDQALLQFLKSIENKFTNLNQTFTLLAESEKEKFLKTIGNFKIHQSFFLMYSSKKPDVSTSAFDIELATKSMILNSGIQMRQAIAGSGDSVAMAKFDDWLMNRNILAMQYSLPIAERRSDLAAFEEKTNRLESELSRVSTTFSQQVSIGRIRWQHVREQLQEGECAIEFSSFNYYDGKRWTDSTFYCALVLTKDCEFPHMFFLFEENELDEALPDPSNGSHWDYNLAYQGIRASGTAVFEQGSYRGDKLYELIWKPIDSLLQDKGIETIYFAPSGLLHTVSFAAMPTPDGQLLMEKYKLVQLGSTRTVAMQQEAVELKNAVVFGGIDYDLEGEELELIAQQFKENESFVYQYMPYRASDTRHGGFTYLEGSLVEARKVSGLLSEKISTTKISGRDAIEESFKALSGNQSPSVIHIATHGFYFPDTISDKSREQMMFTAIGEERFRISDDPLMRSALVMAGANHAWQGKTLPPGVQDGILTARDVSAMNLANTELVVLSACQTGLGDVKGSEGVTGLQRAFKMAGVRYIIMSLWPVPDKETVEFMEAFYGNWLGGMEIRTAFTATQKQMHERYPNEPFKWAAFVLME